MSSNSKGVYTYTRQMRDGSVKEITALLNNPEKRRTGKTLKDKANVKRTKA
jgi:hypothetical protein